VVLLLGMVALASADLLVPAVLIGVSVAYGVLDTMRLTATQSYAYDLVRTGRATSGMALTSLGTQLFSTIGGLVGGYTLQQFGNVPTYRLIAAAALVATVAPMLRSTQAPDPCPPARPGAQPEVQPDDGGTLTATATEVPARATA